MATFADIAATPAPARAPGTVNDFAALAGLRSRATADPGAATAEAARQFEALFVQMMLKSMREAGDVFGDGSDTSYRDMFDQQIALEMTRGQGLGLARSLTQQLAPPAPATDSLRAVAARDFIAAREAAPLSAPNARFELQRSDDAALLEAASRPAFAGEDSVSGATDWNDWRPDSPEEFILSLIHIFNIR